MVDKELLSRKLSRLRTYVEELRRAEDITWEKYRSDPRSRAFVERYIHLAIFVSFYKWREPASFRDLIAILGEHGVIPETHLLTFQRMISFRNMLVHRYDSIDDELVFGIFSKHLVDFDLFIRLVADWVSE